MATSSGPRSVPDVTLQATRGAASGGGGDPVDPPSETVQDPLISVSNVDATTVRFTMYRATVDFAYKVQQSTDSGATWTDIYTDLTLADFEFNHTGLTTGSEYTWRITGTDGVTTVTGNEFTMTVRDLAGIGTFAYKDQYTDADYELDEVNGAQPSLREAGNLDVVQSKGFNCTNSLRVTPRRVAEISGPGAELNSEGVPVISEAVTVPANPAVSALAPETALRFRYNEDTVNDTDNPPTDSYAPANSFAELRYDLVPGAFCGADGTETLWMQWDFYVPENYHTRDTEPEDTDPWVNQGHKILAIYANGYSGPYATWILGTLVRRADFGTSNEGDAYITSQTRSLDPAGERWYSNHRPDLDNIPPLIRAATDVGHWMRVTARAKVASSHTANDGEFDLWVRRRVGETDSYVERIIGIRDSQWYGGESGNLLNGGYLMGYANRGYNYEVNYLVANIILTNNSSEIDQNAIDSSPTIQSNIQSGPNAAELYTENT